MPSYKFDEAIAAGVPIGDINAEAAKRIGYRYEDALAAGVSEEDIHTELRKRYQSQSSESNFDKIKKTVSDVSGKVSDVASEYVPQPIKDAVGGVEAVGAMVANTPDWLYNIGSRLPGKLTGVDVGEGDHLYQVHPATESGKKAEEMLGEGFSKGLSFAGKAITKQDQAIRKATDALLGTKTAYQTPEELKKAEEDHAFGAEGLMAFGAAKALPKQVMGLKDLKVRTTKEDAIRKLVVEEEAKNQKPVGQAQEPGLPELQNAPPIIPGSWKEGMTPKEVETPLPVLPDTLKPLSEQYPQGIDIGAVEAGVFKDNRPLPELPPQDSGLLSLVNKEDHPVGHQDYPANAESFPDTPNIPTLEEHPALIEKRAEIERAWEQKKAQDQAESSATKEDAFARAEAEQAPLTLEPEQGTSGLFGFGKPSPLGGVGKKQGGAINFGFGEKVKKAFSPKTFEEFAKDFYEKNPDLANTSESSVRAAYEKMYPMKSKGALQTKAFGDLVGDKDTYNKYESRPVMDDPLGEKSVERMKGLSGADSEPLGVVKSNVMSAGRMPSWMSKSPIIHEGIQFITSVKDHYRVKSADTMSPINKMFNGSERGISQFVKGIKDTWREAAEVLSVRREHEFDPTFDPKTQFSGKQLELFTKIDETLKNLYTEINARRRQLDPKAQDLPQLPYYFTSFFKGDWAVPVFDSTTGQFLFNLRETKKADAYKAQEWVNQQQGMMAKEVGLLKQSKYVDKKMDAASDFDSLLKTFGSNDPAVVAAMQRLVNSSKRKAGNTAGMPNRFLSKEGRFGSLGDKPWLSDKENYYGNKEALTRYVDGANDWLAHTQIAKFSEGMLKSEKDINAPNAVKFIQDYSDYVIGKKEIASQITKGVDSAISHFLNRSTGDATAGVRTWANALTAQYIGYFSPRAMIQNVFQPISATVPKMLEMGLMEGYKGNPFTALMVGMVEGVLDSVGHATHLPYKTQTLKFKEANHVVDAHLVESGGTFKNVFANDLYDAAANFSVAATEALARSQGFSIFYHYLKSSGMDSAKAMDMAKNLTKEHMVNYEQYAKPQMFGATGIVGEMAGRLQTYKMNATTQMAEYLTKMNHNPKTWVPFSTALGINIALAGAMGVMGMDVAELLWKGVQLADQKITGGSNEIQEWTPKRFIFETLPSSVSMGALSTTTGMDLTGAFAQNLVGDNAAQSVMPIVGGMVNQVTAVPQLLSATNDADTAKALSAFTPTTGKPYVERAFSTMKRPDGETQVLSPTTGNTVYKGPDQGYAKGTTGLITGEGLLSNIRTLDRGYKAYENKFDTEYNHGISVRLKGIEDKTNKVVNDVVKAAVAGKDNPFAKATIGKNFIKYVEIGGDPNDLLNKINSHVQSLAIGDKLVEELSKDITLRNRKQIQHAFELYQRRQEHGSATTSK